ncbi:serine/threonine-protein phosphatase 7 long form-like protein [Senna tora]|uniref:Serine/threonine-protein phosphatase 7 long form-like protein n=1 Tax=Senna tora TaxID=362788 RepID=A0A834TN92_9FABA|nr:serine/threonine-protein phosphatase 7 long form-like protein [Senna tora]
MALKHQPLTAHNPLQHKDTTIKVRVVRLWLMPPFSSNNRKSSSNGVSIQMVLCDHEDTPTMRPRRTMVATYSYLPPTFVPLLISSSFYGASRADFFPYDWHFVTALIMWWRLETHTFHMAIGIGEATITLEDVATQLGLPIDRKEVVESTNYNWAQLGQELLGKTPVKQELEGQRLRISWLEKNFTMDNGPKGDVSDEELHRMVRAYILCLIDGFLMLDTSGNKVSLICLPLLWILEEAGRYSWGSAVLTYLFRKMCERDLGRAHVPLLCFHILEWQQADRVMRQYGMRQCIPEKSEDLDLQHTLKLTNKMTVHWLNHQLPWDETYGVIADRVYEQPVPATEITHICRHMQGLNIHVNPEGAGDHEATRAPIFPYGPLDCADSSRSKPKKMSDSHPLVSILIQQTEDDEAIGHEASESSSGPSTSAQHHRPRDDQDEDDDEDAGAKPLSGGNFRINSHAYKINFQFGTRVMPAVDDSSIHRYGFNWVSTDSITSGQADENFLLILKPFPQGYTIWLRHGETNTIESSSMPTIIGDRSLRDDKIEDMIHDAFRYHPSKERVDEVEEVILSDTNEAHSDDIKHLARGPLIKAK